MSYQTRTITLCDHCDNFEWGHQRDWYVGTRLDDEGKVQVHLCPECQEQVWYCHDCQDFHPLGEECLPEPPEPPAALDDPRYYSLDMGPMHEYP
jgi:predicted RNA-binding Zn-ribbon protein involved in translation (DUF1610 family)